MSYCSSKIRYTYRVQFLPHQHFKVVFFMQQIKYVCHLIVPSNASEETHLQREREASISIAWSSLSQTTTPSLVAFKYRTLAGRRVSGQAAILNSFPPCLSPLLPIPCTQQGPSLEDSEMLVIGKPLAGRPLLCCL